MGRQSQNHTDALPDRRHPHRLDAMSYRMPRETVFVTICSRWSEVLTQKSVAKQLIEVMGRMARRHKIRIHAYCIMPDHVHVVVSVMDQDGDIQKWLRYTKREFARALHNPGMWQRSYWDRHARSETEIDATVDYVLKNPVRRGLCESWRDWQYSWSEWHAGTFGMDANVQ